MKSKLILSLIVTMIAVVGVNAQKLNVQGTWKLIESSGNPLPSEYTQLKLITPTHFIWTLIDDSGNIITGAGGKYTMKGREYTESITMVLPGMKSFLNKNATYNVEIIGKRMNITGNLEGPDGMAIENTEIWERIE